MIEQTSPSLLERRHPLKSCWAKVYQHRWVWHSKNLAAHSEYHIKKADSLTNLQFIFTQLVKTNQRIHPWDQECLCENLWQLGNRKSSQWCLCKLRVLPLILLLWPGHPCSPREPMRQAPLTPLHPSSQAPQGFHSVFLPCCLLLASDHISTWDSKFRSTDTNTSWRSWGAMVLTKASLIAADQWLRLCTVVCIMPCAMFSALCTPRTWHPHCPPLSFLCLGRKEAAPGTSQCSCAGNSTHSPASLLTVCSAREGIGKILLGCSMLLLHS